MTFEEFKATAKVCRDEAKVRWTDKHPMSCIWWHMSKQTDNEVLRRVWWAYYGHKQKVEKVEAAVTEKPVETASINLWTIPTITGPDSSTMDFIKEKCECEAWCE